MRIALFHSRYTSGGSSGENRVVSDEKSLLTNAGHSIWSWEPMLSGRVGPGAATRAVWNGRATAAVREAVAVHRPDVIHVHNLYPSLSPAVIRIAHELRCPVVMTLHNFRLSCLAGTFLRSGGPCESCLGRVPWRGVVHGCYRGSRAASAVVAGSLTLHRSIGTFDKVTLYAAVSRFVRTKLVSGGLSPDRVRVRHNFSWALPRRLGAGSVFLVLGRLSAEKGIETVLRAWDGHGELVIVGDGPERERLEVLAGHQVRFLGELDRTAVTEMLTRARALLVPSLSYEGSPRAIVEALAAGVPVIASDIGGIPEHIEDGVNGLLVDPYNVDAWTSAIQALRNDCMAAALGDAAFARWDAEFSPAAALLGLEALYSEAIERHAVEEAMGNNG